MHHELRLLAGRRRRGRGPRLSVAEADSPPSTRQPQETMKPTRKTDARSSTRDPAQTDRPFAPPGVEAAVRIAGICLLTALLLTSAWRWHQAAADAPLRVTDTKGAAAVVVVQAGDCPDRRAALREWLGARTHALETGELTLHLATVDSSSEGLLGRGGAGAGVPAGSLLESLPTLGDDESRRAGRALLRSGAQGTPALLLLDAAGRPLLATTFTATGPGPGLDDAASTLQALTSSGQPVPTDPQPREIAPWNH